MQNLGENTIITFDFLPKNFCCFCNNTTHNTKNCYQLNDKISNNLIDNNNIKNCNNLFKNILEKKYNKKKFKKTSKIEKNNIIKSVNFNLSTTH